MATTITARVGGFLLLVCSAALVCVAGCAGVPDCNGNPQCSAHPQATSVYCNLTRNECTQLDGNGNCTQSMPRTETNILQCYASGTATAACALLCNASDQMMPGGYTNCSTSVSTTQAPPSAMCAASGIPAPVEYDSVICTKTGRNCTFFDEASNCLSLGSLTTITASDPCVDLRTQSAYDYCAGATNPDGTSLDRTVVKLSSYTRNVTCPAQSPPVPPLDRSFGLANGTTIASTIGGAATNFTTKGGRAVVTYACDSTGEFCNPQSLKEIELDINDATVMGLPFTNIRLVSSGPISIGSGNKLSSSGPGFDLSALYYGLTVKNHVNPTSTIQLTGSYTGTNFGIATSPSFQMGLFGGYTQVSGTVNVAGSPGGVQINCGDFGAIAPFIADTDFSGGAEKDRTNVIDLTKVTNPAPMKVYQNQHYASPFTYTVPGFTAGSNHLIRLHFAETNPANNGPNKRKFSVAINGTTQISNLDLFATVGMNTAYIKEFTLPANSSGAYVLSFTASLDSATISGIEVL